MRLKCSIHFATSGKGVKFCFWGTWHTHDDVNDEARQKVRYNNSTFLFHCCDCVCEPPTFMIAVLSSCSMRANALQYVEAILTLLHSFKKCPLCFNKISTNICMPYLWPSLMITMHHLWVASWQEIPACIKGYPWDNTGSVKSHIATQGFNYDGGRGGIMPPC